ncbi:iron chelate uptake ABC transporter family permease subunit [Paracoccus jiaweipingae]|uniref:iron chelate uptake ABC transporter family permease subunit n=1 Tax=unclassified Paracoccus (in: a-proteobacteria) TaxID=2688777 RepID=UPI0037A74704
MSKAGVWSRHPAALRLAGLLALLAVLAGLWLLAGLGAGNRGFIIGLRATRLAALVTVGASVGVATMLFQTVTANRVLTPSIMGFDALYLLLQNLLVLGLGVTGFAALAGPQRFALETGVMVALAATLFGTLLAQGTRDIARTVLTGVILGVLFRAASGLVARIADPSEYAIIQYSSFASFSRVDPAVLPWAMAATGVAVLAAMAMAARLDVLALGRDGAVSLGLRHDRVTLVALGLVAVLVSTATALVGPVAFFGLIVSGLTHALMRSPRHVLLLPAAALIAMNLLLAGQLLFDRLLGQQGTLSVVIEFAGGLFFLSLLLKGRIR